MKKNLTRNEKLRRLLSAFLVFVMTVSIATSAGIMGITHGLQSYSDWDSLKYAIENQVDLSCDYVLDADVEATSSISVPAGKTITVTGGKKINVTSSMTDENVFYVGNGSKFSVENISFIASDDSGNVRAIYNDEGTVTLTSVTVDSFTGTDLGGAVCSLDGDVSLKGCTVKNCSTTAGGGAIYVYSSNTKKNLTISDGTTIDSCSSSCDDDAVGGAVYSKKSIVNISDSTISNCFADMYGGGVCCDMSTVLEMNNSEITKCKVTCPYGTGGGGGISVIASSSAVLNDTDISYCETHNTNSVNGGGGGGGIFVSMYTFGRTRSTLEINNCDISNCSSTFTGGGIAAGLFSTCTINSGTISNCTSKLCGGGIYVEQGNSAGTDSSKYAVLNLNPVSVYSNTSSTHGGGIYSCPAASKNVIGAYAASIFENTAETAGDDYFANTRNTGNSGATTLSVVPLGGSNPDIYVDEESNRYSDGYYIDASADYYTNTTKIAALHNEYSQDEKNYSKTHASVYIYDNSVTGENAYGGGGIGCNGVMIIQSKPDITSVNIEKVWTDIDGNVTNIHPDSVDVQLWRVSLSESDYKAPETVGDPVTLSADNSWSYDWTNLDEGYSYYVTEASDLTGWKESYNIIRDENDETKLLITLTNSNDMCMLKISKTVENDTEYTPADKEFSFTVSSDVMTETYSYSIYNSATDEKIDTFPIENGGTIKLHDGEYAVIENVPEGLYSVTEIGEQNYIGKIMVTDTGDDTKTSINENTDLDVTASGVTDVHNMLTFDCVNTYSPTAKAKLSVEKKTDGNTLSKKFAFALYECDENGEWESDAEPIKTALSDISDSTSGIVEFGSITLTEYNTVKYYAIKEITEDGSGWDCDNETTIYAKVTIAPADAVTGEVATSVLYGTELSGGVLIDGNPDVKSITNTYGFGNLSIKKTGTGYEETPDKYFAITLSGANLSLVYESGILYTTTATNVVTNTTRNIQFMLSAGQLTCFLKINEIVTFTDLPLGNYIVSERAYENNITTVTVTVNDVEKDSETGSRGSVVSITGTVVKDGETEFTVDNVFSPAPDDIIEIPQITKDGSGYALDKVFTFGLYECNKDGILASETPLSTVSTTVTEETTQTVDFDKITYNAEGRYYYAINETTEDGDGWICDNDTTMYVVIIVTEHPGENVGDKPYFEASKLYGTALIDGELSDETTDVPTISNTKDVPVDFEFIKTNSRLDENLSGAEFALYKCESTELNHVHEPDVGSADFCFTTKFADAESDEDGKVSFTDLAADEQYLLVETKAPSGYALPKSGWLVTVSVSGEATIKAYSTENQPPAFAVDDNGIYKCVNNSQTALPGTGGNKTIWLFASGFLMMMSALGLFILNFKKKLDKMHQFG